MECAEAISQRRLERRLHSIRDWVLRYNDDGPGGLADRPRSGRRCRLSDAEKRRVASWMKKGPDPKEDGMCRWRLRDLRDRVKRHFNTLFSLEGIRLLIGSMDFRMLSPRPIHPKADPVKQFYFRLFFRALAMDVVLRALSRIGSISGSRTRPELARRACSPGYGHSWAAARGSRPGPSLRIPSSPPPCRPDAMRCLSWTEPDGTVPRTSKFRPTLSNDLRLLLN